MILKKGDQRTELPWMDNDESWFNITRKCKTATERGKGWGRFTSAHRKECNFKFMHKEENAQPHNTISSRVTPCKSCLCSSPLPVARLRLCMTYMPKALCMFKARLNAQAEHAVKAMHKVLISEHGPLDLAPKPTRGQIIPLQIRIENTKDSLSSQSGTKSWRKY